MKDSALRLQDKTILLVGPFNGITQAIVRTLTEFGADVAFVSEPSASRYVDGVNEAREVHAHYGRAVHYGMPFSNDREVQEVLGRVVESLGRMDALVDATPLTWTAATDPSSAKNLCMSLSEKLVPFFLAKQRGRIVYVLEDNCLDALRTEPGGGKCRDQLFQLIETLAQKYSLQNITVNSISLGVTDDFLLRAFPKTPSLKRQFEELQKSFPGVKLVDSHEVSLSVAYLTSALCASLTGQQLRLTHGYHLLSPVTAHVNPRPALIS